MSQMAQEEIDDDESDSSLGATRENDEEEILKAMLQIITTSRQKLRPILQKLAQNKYGTTGPDRPDNSIMTLFDSIIREMFIILLRLPYLSLLRETLKSGNPVKDKTAALRTLSSCSPMST
jgi:hypothetical protein